MNGCICENGWGVSWPPRPPEYDNCSENFGTFTLASNIVFMVLSVAIAVYSAVLLYLIDAEEHYATKRRCRPTIQKGIHLAIFMWAIFRMVWISLVLSNAYQTAPFWLLQLINMLIIFLRDTLLLLFCFWWIGVAVKLSVSPELLPRVWRYMSFTAFAVVVISFLFLFVVMVIVPLCVAPHRLLFVGSIYAIMHISFNACILFTLVACIIFLSVWLRYRRMDLLAGRAKLLASSFLLILTFIAMMLFDSVMINLQIPDGYTSPSGWANQPYLYYFNYIFYAFVVFLLLTCNQRPYRRFSRSDFSADFRSFHPVSSSEKSPLFYSPPNTTSDFRVSSSPASQRSSYMHDAVLLAIDFEDISLVPDK